LLFGQVASGAVYKTVDEHGNVVYTDDPVGHGEPVNLPPLSTVPPPRYQTVSPAQTGKAEARPAYYQQLTIMSPTQDETVRDNPGNVTILAGVNPELNIEAGDRLQFYLDGKPVGEASEAEKVTIPNVDRGAHTVAVAVVDTAGKELKRSDEVRFYLHRQSINFPNRNPPKPAPTSR